MTELTDKLLSEIAESEQAKMDIAFPRGPVSVGELVAEIRRLRAANADVALRDALYDLRLMFSCLEVNPEIKRQLDAFDAKHAEALRIADKRRKTEVSA